MSKFVQTDYGNNKEILMLNEFTAISVIVDKDEGIDVDGKKIVKAGTIVGGATQSVFKNPNEPVVAKNDAEADGILLSDVDVTHGNKTASMVIHGFINKNNLPEAPTAEAVEALHMIKFMV